MENRNLNDGGALLVYGMESVMDRDSEFSRLLREAKGMWSHLGIFPERLRPGLAVFLGLAPSLRRYVGAWRACGSRLSDIADYEMQYSAANCTLRIDRSRHTGALQTMLLANDFPLDHCATGIIDDQFLVSPEVVLMTGLPGVEQLDHFLSGIPMQDECEDDVCEGASAQVDQVSADGVLSDCESDDVASEIHGRDGGDHGVSETYECLVSSQFRAEARAAFGKRVSYAALLAMPSCWFDMVGLHSCGFFGPTVTAYDRLAGVVSAAGRAGWVFPSESLGSAFLTLDGGSCGESFTLDDEVLCETSVSGLHVGDAGGDTDGFCYRKWAAAFPDVASLGPWPTGTALGRCGVPLVESNSYLAHAGYVIQAPRCGVVGGDSFAYAGFDGNEVWRVNEWYVKVDSEDGNGAVLCLRRLGDHGKETFVTLDDNVVYRIAGAKFSLSDFAGVKTLRSYWTNAGKGVPPMCVQVGASGMCQEISVGGPRFREGLCESLRVDGWRALEHGPAGIGAVLGVHIPSRGPGMQRVTLSRYVVYRIVDGVRSFVVSYEECLRFAERWKEKEKTAAPMLLVMDDDVVEEVNVGL